MTTSIPERLAEMGVPEAARTPVLRLYAETALTLPQSLDFYWHVHDHMAGVFTVTDDRVSEHYRAHMDWQGMCPWLYEIHKVNPPRSIRVSGDDQEC